MFICEATIFDFEIGVNEVCPAFRVRNLTSRGVKDESADRELRKAKAPI